MRVFWLELNKGSPMSPAPTASFTAASSETPRIVCIGIRAVFAFRAA
jgi:hypothetical protein